MATGKFIAYHRVSTAKQGASGLGLEAQQAAVTAYLNGGAWTLLGTFVEVESGKRNDRPQLTKALAQCKLTGATLIIAKLDRLARNVAFIANLTDSGVEFIAVDQPHATRFTLHILAAVAEHEAKMISARTKAALAAAKARGKTLGGFRGYVPDAALGRQARHAASEAFAADVGPIVAKLRRQGRSLRGRRACQPWREDASGWPMDANGGRPSACQGQPHGGLTGARKQ
jgi:DNA invertase Pin-like site-specific DNA recombinase